MKKIKLSSIIESRITGYLIILIFIILKLPHLDYPFFWDESWPYASAIHSMYQHGPSLSPDAIDPNLTRGHPTLWIFMVATWMKIFGTSLIAIHSFPLLVSTLFSISIYEIARKLFNPITGIFALLLIIFQLIFFVQSSLVLLEISLAFAALSSIYFYSTNQLKWLTFSLLILFFIKETGTILGLSLGIMSIIRWLKRDINLKEFLRHLMVFSIPVIAYVVFFSIQKKLLGWYFFPFHVELVEINYPVIRDKFIAGLSLLTIEDNRRLLLQLLALFMAVVLVSKWDVLKNNIAQFSFETFFGEKWSEQKTFVLTILLFIPVFLFFSGMNVFINRYYLIVLVPFYFLYALIFASLVKKFNASSFFIIAGLLISFHVYSFKNSYKIGDNDLGAFKIMRVEQSMISYMEKHYPYDTPISTNAFLIRTQLTDPNTRYLSSDKKYTNVNWEVNANTKVALFSNKEDDSQREAVINNGEYKMVIRFENGNTWGEIYERK